MTASPLVTLALELGKASGELARDQELLAGRVTSLEQKAMGERLAALERRVAALEARGSAKRHKPGKTKLLEYHTKLLEYHNGHARP
jgi:hypothetical protein